MNADFDALMVRLKRADDLNAAADVLEWDQETYMPDGGAPARARQIATIREMAHEVLTADEVGTLLGRLEPTAEPGSFEAALLRVARRDYDRAVKIPNWLVSDLAHAVAMGKQAWKNARENDAFGTFAPHLQTIVDLNIQKAEAIGFSERVYDALLDEYEPGMRTAEIEQIFSDLRTELVQIVKLIARDAAPDDHFLHAHYARQKQWDFGLNVAKDFGYDLNRGRQDLSAHPFTTSFSINDVRVTTRIMEDYLPSALFGTLHETGHALYEQGIDPAYEGTPLAEGASLAVHESQSRLWENLVGRSLAFWRHYYPRLQELFPENLRQVQLGSFYRAINRVQPSLIRVEADEVTYNLHIMLRFELENALLERRLKVDDLPGVWNDRMESYLGLRPKNDAEGVLQDVHWSLGAIGYFPTYALGNLMSAQIFRKLEHDIPHISVRIGEGNFRDLLAWLREHIHRHGRAFTANELLARATGEPLTASYWLGYVRQKYSAIYPSLS